QEVVLSESGPVSLRHAFVDTDLDLPGVETAHLTVRAQLQNSSNEVVKGTIRGKITGAARAIEFVQPVELAAKESRPIEISSNAAPGLDIEKPRLWWPFQMGEPYLHHLTIEFHLE